MRWKLPGVEPGDTKGALIGLWEDRCYICGGPLGAMHVEHVQPRSAGGGDTLANLRPACAACNLAKGAKPLAEYLAYRKQKGEPVDASAHRAGLRPTAAQMYAAASLGVKWSGKYAWAAQIGRLGAPTALGPTPLAFAFWTWQAWQFARSEAARKLGQRAKDKWDARNAPNEDEWAAMQDSIAARESACQAAAAANAPSAGPWSQAWQPGDEWLDCLERSLEGACGSTGVDYWPRRDWRTINLTCVELSRMTLHHAISASGRCLDHADPDKGYDIPPPVELPAPPERRNPAAATASRAASWACRLARGGAGAAARATRRLRRNQQGGDDHGAEQLTASTAWSTGL